MKAPGQKNNAGEVASAAAAWVHGLAGGPDAIAWLGRAVRLAPNDPRVALDLAHGQMSGTEAEIRAAADSFETIAKRHGTLASWLGLATTRYRLGDIDAAGTALEQLLTQHCMLEAPEFTELALCIATAAGYGGILGVTATGETVRHGAGRLLGDTPDRAALTRLEGLVAVEKGGLSGWASRPAAPSSPPALTLLDAAGRRISVQFDEILPPDDDAPLLIRHRFKISATELCGLTPPFSLRGSDGVQIMGSPIDPAGLNLPPIPAGTFGPPITHLPERGALAIIVPVYRGLAETQDCLRALYVATPAGAEIIVVDDATPERALAAWLDDEAAAARFTLCRHAENQGFSAAVNTGLAAAAGRDVLLLNSDTLVPPGAIETLREVAYADAATGSVTPLSNEATILSYPNRRGGNRAPGLAGTTALNALAYKANGLTAAEIPTGIGFCMYLRHDCLQAAGGLRAEIFAQGYGEENDWCFRTQHLGFRHLAALGVYVTHLGGVSFRSATRGLLKRNTAIINQLYPGCHKMIMTYIQADPLGPMRKKLDTLRLTTQPPQDSVLLISHSHGGGVGRQVAAQMAELRAKNLRPLLLATQFPANPEKTPYPWPALLSEGEAGDYPNLGFNLPGDLPALLELLKAMRVSHVELHHTLGHHPSVRELASLLGVTQDIVIHDYGSFCPRVNLLTPGDKNSPQRYCGEPSIAGCIECCARAPGDLYDALQPPELRARSAAEFAQASRVIAPSSDAARRIARHFPGVKPVVTPWENDAEPVSLRPPGRGPRKIIVIGGIGRSKGFALLADCARDASARGLGLEFTVAGGSADDAALLDAGIFVTGHYAEHEVQALIASLKPDLAFLPSIWPETWCFTLSEAWRAGLYAVAFDLGAPAERIKATKRGLTLPLGLPVPRINDILLKWTP